MSQYLITVALFAFFIQPVQSSALEIKEPDRLFASSELLELVIEAPLAEIMDERSIDEDTPAKLRYSDAQGNIIEFDIGVRARGNYRRRPDVCDFAPLRLNFKKSTTQKTIFDHQDKLKLVTHCQNSSPRYDQYVLSEYLAYRILNLITDVSFRARLIQITYIDTARRNRDMVRLAMFIEHRDRLAARNDFSPAGLKTVQFGQLDPAHANINSVFHYFIGNTDYSQIVGPPDDDDCCHNHSLFAAKGDFYISVPYDFDLSGLVNAPHALPASRFKLRSVRQRLYRGRCFNNVYLETSVEKFSEQHDNIYGLIDSQKLMTKATRRATIKFIDDFFKTVNNPKKVEKELTENCT